MRKEIAERKKADKILRELSSRYEAILSAVPDIIVEVNSNKVYTWSNQAGFEFFGKDVLGKEAAFYFEGEQDTYKMVQPLFDGDETMFYIESWQRRKDDEKRLLAWWCRVLKDENGNVTGALSTARDITEHQKMEKKMQITCGIAQKKHFCKKISLEEVVQIREKIKIPIVKILKNAGFELGFFLRAQPYAQKMENECI